MIVLRSEELLALVDPAHGAEMLELVHLSTGRRVLGRPPFATEPAVAGDLPEDLWTASYRGGWQPTRLAAPAFGAASWAPFSSKARVSSSPWTSAAASSAST